MNADHTPELPLSNRMATVAILVMAVAFPVVAMFNNRAIVPMCVGLAVLVVWAWQPGNIWTFIRSVSPVTRYLLCGLFVWMAISVTWSPDASRSLVTLGKLGATAVLALALIGPASFLFDHIARRLLWVTFFAATIVSSVLIFDIYTDGIFSLNVLGKGIHAPYGAFWFKPVATLLAITMWPVAVFHWRESRRGLSVFSMVLSMVMLHAISVSTGMIALAAGLAAGGCFLTLGRWRAWVSIALLSVTFLAAPIVVGPLLQPGKVTSELSLLSPSQNSLAYRLHIWHFAANTYLEKPLTGWGLGASRHLGDGVTVSDSVRGEIGEAIPLHPHNAILQIYLELGIVGALLVLGLLCRLIISLSSGGWSPTDRVFAFGMFMSTLLFYAVSFSAWSSWWNAYVCYVIALFFISRRSSIEVE